MTIENIISASQSGKMVLIYDDEKREGETDIVIGSQFITPEHIKKMRKDAGGLICTTLAYEYAELLDLPYLTDAFMSSGYPLFKQLYPDDIPYDEISSFSITINHRNTFTGINDKDRTLTIREFANFLTNLNGQNKAKTQEEFGKRFRSPGHVHLLKSSEKLLNQRKGHTELATSLMKMAGLVPSATIVEMLGDDGYSLSKKDAMEYATKNGLIFIEGKEIIEAWKKWSE